MTSITVLRPQEVPALPPQPKISRRLLAAMMSLLVGTTLSTFFAFRSAQALRDAQRQSRLRLDIHHTLSADTLAKKVTASYARTLAQLSERAHIELSQKPLTTQALQKFWAFNSLGGLPVEHVYVVRSSGEMIFPMAYHEFSKLERSVPPVAWGVWQKDVAQLEALAGEREPGPQVLLWYHSLLEKVSERRQRVALIQQMAALYWRMGDPAYAAALYKRLSLTEDQTLDASGLPVGVVARQALADLYESQNDVAQSAATRLELARGAVERRWALPSQTADKLFEDAAVAITPLSPSLTRLQTDWKALQAERFRVIAARQDSEHFYASVWPALRAELTQRSWLEKGGIVGGPQDGELYFVSAQPAGYCIAQMSRGVLQQDALRSIYDLSQSFGVDVRFQNQHRAGYANSRLQRAILIVEPPVTLHIIRQSAPTTHAVSWMIGWFLGMVATFIALFVLWRNPPALQLVAGLFEPKQPKKFRLDIVR